MQFFTAAKHRRVLLKKKKLNKRMIGIYLVFISNHSFFNRTYFLYLKQYIHGFLN